MKKNYIRIISEVAMFAALAVALDIIQGPLGDIMFANGGSIGIAMLPILIISYRRGLVSGLACGLIVSLVQMISGIWVFSADTSNGFIQVMAPVIQVSCDYVLAYTLVGLAGVFAKKYMTSDKKYMWLILGCVLGGMAKYLCHVISGAFFWPTEDWGLSSTAFAFVYNACYCLPNIILCLGIMLILHRVYPQFLNIEYVSEENKQ
jgi:thiamine transporter